MRKIERIYKVELLLALAISILFAMDLFYLNKKVVGRTEHGFHRADILAWCEAMVLENPGLKCIDGYSIPRQPLVD